MNVPDELIIWDVDDGVTKSEVDGTVSITNRTVNSVQTTGSILSCTWEVRNDGVDEGGRETGQSSTTVEEDGLTFGITGT